MTNQAQFLMRLDLPDSLEQSNEPFSFDPELDTEVSLIADVCDALSSDEQAKFRLVVGGVERHLDVWADLAAVMPQMPNLHSLPETFVLDFFEQGTEMLLTFAAVDDQYYLISCRSKEPLRPQQAQSAKVAKAEVQQILKALVHEFTRAAEVLRPQVARHPVFSQWQARVQGASA